MDLSLIDRDIRLLEVRPASEDPGQVRLPKREVGRFVVRDYEHSGSELVLFVQEYATATPLVDIPEPSPTGPSVDEPTASTRPRCPLCSSDKERARVHGGIGTEPGRAPGMLPQMTPPDWWRLLAVVDARVVSPNLLVQAAITEYLERHGTEEFIRP